MEARDFVEMATASDDTEMQQRGRNVEQGISGISSRVKIVMGGMPKGAMAFVEANDNNVAYLGFDYTGDKETTSHALVHEDNHNRLKFWNLPLTDDFTSAHAQILEEGVGLSLKSDNEALMEGFHEMMVITKKGVDSNVAYNQREVPAAQKLENLSKQILGTSLLNIYKTGNHEKMATTLKKLADRCLLLKAVVTSPEIPSIDRPVIEAKIKKYSEKVNSPAQALEIVERMQSEALVDKLLSTPANDQHDTSIAA